ncbi:Transmembrane 9 superfamily member 9 [Zea mays]|uniref:Transmembrane 9 superfamily member 9 n=1 Tax=Zea mays TaxID=4577 RepID=A0A1D6KMV4_MAIZE|nr:Transmembrane 9 superfamily member 9 [Zea mays]
MTHHHFSCSLTFHRMHLEFETTGIHFWPGPCFKSQC